MAGIVIEDYDPQWPAAFAAVAARLAGALGALPSRIEHIGSTAVPGLCAKPIIDVDVVLSAAKDLPQAIGRLASLGYVHEGDLGIEGREAFRPPDGEALHHVYVLAEDAAELARHLAFRDTLRADAALRNRYAALKRALAGQYADDRPAYTRAKTDFIAAAIRDRVR